ncbi:RNA methyltransferase [Flaviflexus salsibiostraticola]|uniref:RNA methyltransferase n=1 Tax=Flaviflexus salsibiostraticola TaxID=1282737 RepID=A0A3Q8WSB9_9ACTO|nr:RNA methyltransferase [Flaviflexus salsibiostraticola]AZN29123.1 RNA methyltransferase [Flaviflexus salsibiostraticola]
MYVELTVADERLADYTSLTDVALRRRLETERGLYMAESTNVIMRAVQAGHRPRSFLTARKWLDSLTPWIELACGTADGGETPVYIAEEEVLEEITGFHLHRGAMAAMNRPELADPFDLIENARLIAVIEDVVDHTNVGAIFRSCAALGVDCVLVTPGCADPLYRRSVRVSMGTVFQVPWTRVSPWPGAITSLREQGWEVAAMALSDDSVSLPDYCAGLETRKVALLFGTEGDGLTRQAIESSSVTVRIPMAGGVDSLNVAAASAVAVYAVAQALRTDT